MSFQASPNHHLAWAVHLAAALTKMFTLSDNLPAWTTNHSLMVNNAYMKKFSIINCTIVHTIASSHNLCRSQVKLLPRFMQFWASKLKYENNANDYVFIVENYCVGGEKKHLVFNPLMSERFIVENVYHHLLRVANTETLFRGSDRENKRSLLTSLILFHSCSN